MEYEPTVYLTESMQPIMNAYQNYCIEQNKKDDYKEWWEYHNLWQEIHR